MVYDDLYRLTQVDAQYAGGNGWVSPFAAEESGAVDPRLAQPSPHVSFPRRIQFQSFAYDWLGNTTATNDDAQGFYDRSLGTITSGTAASGPYQLRAAANASGTPNAGALTAAYDAAGNLTSLAVQRSGPCLPAGAQCSQRSAYDWDEVGRLVRARRWDLASAGAATDALPTAVPNADLRYAYDSGNQRVLKTAEDGQGNQRYTVFVFGSLELRRAAWVADPSNPALFDYDDSAGTEVPYLAAHGERLARVEYDASDPSIGSSAVHVLLEMEDHLGSTGIVIDKATGELVERTTYQAFGATESDYRPQRWDTYREDYRFTGKEEDAEVGLTYFGERFYAAALGRWMSPDPLAVHDLGADLNLYAYVHGNVFKAVDPLGLQDEPGHLTLPTVCIDVHVNENDRTEVVPCSPAPAPLPTGNGAGGAPSATKSATNDGTEGAPSGVSSAPPDEPSFPFNFNERAKQWREEAERDQRQSGAGGAPPALMSSPPIAGCIPFVNFVTAVPSDHSSAPANVVGASLSIVGLKGLPSLSTAPRVAAQGVGSGASFPTGPMQIVRTIAKGEKVADIISEGKALTFDTGNEHALVKLASGARAIVSGGPGGITWPAGAVTRIFGHTHPYELLPAGPSGADFDALLLLGQRSSWVVERGRLIRFTIGVP
jgi:RHS repeat-associated protein